MTKKILLGFGVFALAVASAKTYSITLFQPSELAGKELKPGDYKVEVEGTRAVIRAAKVSVEAPVKVEENGKKFDTTSVQFDTAGGKYRIREIHLGGTKTTLTFQDPMQGSSGSTE
jgi:hypothetical protein